jgi:hypothetical protein
MSTVCVGTLFTIIGSGFCICKTLLVTHELNHVSKLSVRH